MNWLAYKRTLSNNFQLYFSTSNCNKYNIQLQLITFIFNVFKIQLYHKTFNFTCHSLNCKSDYSGKSAALNIWVHNWTSIMTLQFISRVDNPKFPFNNPVILGRAQTKDTIKLNVILQRTTGLLKENFGLSTRLINCNDMIDVQLWTQMFNAALIPEWSLL